MCARLCYTIDSYNISIAYVELWGYVDEFNNIYFNVYQFD